MKKINLRKMLLALADVFIIVVSGILANYILLLVGYIGAASSKGLLSYIVIDLVMCLFTLYISGTYSNCGDTLTQRTIWCAELPSFRGLRSAL